MDTVVTIGNWVCAAAAIGGILFLLLYSALTRMAWTKSREGWYIAGLSFVLAMLFGYNYAAFSGWLGPLTTEHRAIGRLVVYTLGFLLVLGLGILLLLAQTEAYRNRRRLNQIPIQRTRR